MVCVVDVVSHQGKGPQMPSLDLPWGAGPYYNPAAIGDTLLIYHNVRACVCPAPAHTASLCRDPPPVVVVVHLLDLYFKTADDTQLSSLGFPLFFTPLRAIHRHAAPACSTVRLSPQF